MSNNDHDRLDLSAWEAPPPPANLADVVIERMGGMEVPEIVPTPARETPRRSPWVIGGAVAAVVAGTLGTYALVRSTERAAPRNGAVVAERPRTLTLDDVTATLEAGADVRWKRKSDGLYVEQRAGVASWRVDRGEKLVIDVGAPASADAAALIEATGANLRVEVPMIATDTKIVGATALTSAAALITVVVYAGDVKVHDRGQTLVVQPGATYQIQPVQSQDLVGAVPRVVDPDHPRADVRISAGESSVFHSDAAEGSPLRVEIDGSVQCGPDIEVEVDGARQGSVVTVAPGDHTYVVRCTNQPNVVAARGQLTVTYDDGTEPLLERFRTGERSEPLVELVSPDPFDPWDNMIKFAGKTVPATVVTVGRLEVPIDQSSRFAGATPTPVSGVFVLRASHPQRGIHYYVRHAPPKLVSTCDAHKYTSRGWRKRGADDAAALGDFETSLRCKRDPRVIELAFMQSCVLDDQDKARRYYAQLTPSQKNRMGSICHRPEYTDKPEPCDADALKDKAMEMITMGLHEEALAQSEASLVCKDESYVRQLAFMEACRAGNAYKARYHFAKLTRTQQEKFAQICVRQGIDVETTPGTIAVQSTPPAEVLIDGKDTGQMTPARLQVTPGKHKVTYVVGKDRFTFPIKVNAGEEVWLDKDLE